MTKEMIISKIAGLQSQNLRYAANLNAFVGNGYTSAAGNHYFNLVRFGEGILIKEDLGQGFKYLFLNGLKVYSVKEKSLIADLSFHNVIYGKEKVINAVKNMLLNKLKEAANQEGFSYSLSEAQNKVSQIVEESFVIDQRTMADNQIRRLGN